MAGAAQATTVTPIVGATSGLNNADMSLTFSEVDIAARVEVEDAFEDYGVIFGDGVVRNANRRFFANILNDRLGNFTSGNNRTNPISIMFTENVLEATFALVTNPGTTVFTAWLDGTLVSRFAASTTAFDRANFFGFTGGEFDEIRIVAGGRRNLAFFDNLSFNTVQPVPVPLPVAGSLLLAGVAGLGMVGRRKRAA